MIEPEIKRARGWWQTPGCAALCALAAAVPLLFSKTPPLVDVPLHMARYHVALTIDQSPLLQRWFEFHWAPIGNLGVDLLVMLLAPLIGLEPAVWVIVALIPPLFVAGLFAVSAAVHGRPTEATAFAAPLIFGYGFAFGFINYWLSAALALLAFALWVRIGSARPVARAALFVPIGFLLYFCHVFGLGILGLLCLGWELRCVIDQRDRRLHMLGRAALGCLPLLPPVLFLLAVRSGSAATMLGWFDLKQKLIYALSVFRDQWMIFDIAGAALIWALILFGIVRFRDRMHPGALIAMLLLGAAFVIMPRLVFGSAYADMRLAPIVAAAGVLALRPGLFDRWLRRDRVAMLALAFVALRFGANAAVVSREADGFAEQLAFLDDVPRGARVLALIGATCPRDWSLDRQAHSSSFVITRRDGFVNDQFYMPGGQLLELRYRGTGKYADAVNQNIDYRCPSPSLPAPPWPVVLQQVPREGFDLLWVQNLPQGLWPRARWLRPIRSDAMNILFRIERPSPRVPAS